MSFSASSLELSSIKNFRQHIFCEDENGTNQETLGGILSNSNYAWLVKGSSLAIIDCEHTIKIGGWNFGSFLREGISKVVCVEEIDRPHRKVPLLAIGIDNGSSGSLICIVDCVGSKVLRAIQISKNVTALHVIDGGQDVSNLSGPLKNFDGILAIGASGGNVYIVDISWQIWADGFRTDNVRAELNPCNLVTLTSKDILDIENHKQQAIWDGNHLGIYLNVIMNKTTEHFVLKGPEDDDRVYVNAEEVAISSLHYCPQLGSILVGYNFGAYQLWNLMNLQLVYTSPVCEDHIPITHFAIQEPADDPRAFCYIWTVYSSNDFSVSTLPYAVMYGFSYESKDYNETTGVLYENFQFCSVRFQMELGGSNQIEPSTESGKCIRLNTLVQKGIKSSDRSTEDMLSLCYFVSTTCSKGELFTFLTIFDLNQWYKEQMPNVPKMNDFSNYMIQLCPNDILKSIGNGEPVLDMLVKKKGLQQFVGVQKLEEHFCPTSLSFDTCCLLENKMVYIYNQGLQKALLSQIELSGSLCLVRPSEYYEEIVSLGLVPVFLDVSSKVPVSLNIQRELILNVALEQQLIGWLCKCASEWANGSFTSAGCSLDSLLSWTFQRALVLKNNCDKICVPLFDYSGMTLDTNMTNLLNNSIRQLKNIGCFYGYVIQTIPEYIDLESISEQYNFLKMIETYFDVLQWLFNVGLLPECPINFYPRRDEFDRVGAPYPVEKLEEYYRERRTELQILHQKKFGSKDSLLFIDNLIDIECGGDLLQKQWENDGGSGLYPPNSLQALLRTYLVDNIDESYKHAVIIYVFLDLATTLDQERYKPVVTHLIKFPAVFRVSPSVIKITQAFWQLDHGDFQTAMDQVFDSLVHQEDLKSWHHRIVLRSLVLQNQHNLALFYLRITKPSIVDDEDVMSIISLYVAKNMLDEAFYFRELHHASDVSDKYLKHLFNECDGFDKLKSIVYRRLTHNEERAFLTYLKEMNHPKAKALTIFYFLQRSRYIEAFDTHEKSGIDSQNKGLIAQNQMKFSDKLIQSYRKILPPVYHGFVDSCRKRKVKFWKEVAKPKPLSVFVHNVNEQAKYKSTMMYAALANAKQTFNDKIDDMMEDTINTEDTPFLRTPSALSFSERVRGTPTIIASRGEECYGPSPSKRARLSSNTSLSMLRNSATTLDTSKLETPIIKRKATPRVSRTISSRLSDDFSPSRHSILKMRPSFSSRKLVDKVRFDVPNLPSSSTDKSLVLSISKDEFPSLQKISHNESSLDVTSGQKSLTPRSSSGEVYFSPDSSLADVVDIEKDEEKFEETKEPVGDIIAPLVSDQECMEVVPVEPKKLVDYDSTSKESLSISSPEWKPSCRQSLRKSTEVHAGPSTLLRSSPRLAKRSKEESRSSDVSSSVSSIDKSLDKDEKQEQQSEDSLFSLKTPSFPRLKPRKSLSRRVLESNTLAKLRGNSNIPFTPPIASRTLITTFTSREETNITSVVDDGTEKRTSHSSLEQHDVYVKEFGDTGTKSRERHEVLSTSNVSKEVVCEESLDETRSAIVEKEEESNRDIEERRAGVVSKEVVREESVDQTSSAIVEKEEESNRHIEERRAAVVSREVVCEESLDQTSSAIVEKDKESNRDIEERRSAVVSKEVVCEERLDQTSSAIVEKEEEFSRDIEESLEEIVREYESTSAEKEVDEEDKGKVEQKSADGINEVQQSPEEDLEEMLKDYVEEDIVISQDNKANDHFLYTPKNTTTRRTLTESLRVDFSSVSSNIPNEELSSPQDLNIVKETSFEVSLAECSGLSSMDSTQLSPFVFDHKVSSCPQIPEWMMDKLYKNESKTDINGTQEKQENLVEAKEDDRDKCIPCEAEQERYEQFEKSFVKQSDQGVDTDLAKQDEVLPEQDEVMLEQTSSDVMEPDEDKVIFTDISFKNEKVITSSEPVRKLEAFILYDENDRCRDPKMNVFEISDDLDVKEDDNIEDLVPHEDDEINEYDDEPNDLENLMQENVSVVGSPPKELEQNVFEDDFTFEEQSQHSDSEPEDNDLNKSDDVIEINSSDSEESRRNQNSFDSSDSQRSTDQKSSGLSRCEDSEDSVSSFEKNVYGNTLSSNESNDSDAPSPKFEEYRGLDDNELGTDQVILEELSKNDNNSVPGEVGEEKEKNQDCSETLVDISEKVDEREEDVTIENSKQKSEAVNFDDESQCQSKESLIRIAVTSDDGTNLEVMEESSNQEMVVEEADSDVNTREPIKEDRDLEIEPVFKDAQTTEDNITTGDYENPLKCEISTQVTPGFKKRSTSYGPKKLSAVTDENNTAQDKDNTAQDKNKTAQDEDKTAQDKNKTAQDEDKPAQDENQIVPLVARPENIQCLEVRPEEVTTKSGPAIDGLQDSTKNDQDKEDLQKDINETLEMGSMIRRSSRRLSTSKNITEASLPIKEDAETISSKPRAARRLSISSESKTEATVDPKEENPEKVHIKSPKRRTSRRLSSSSIGLKEETASVTSEEADPIFGSPKKKSVLEVQLVDVSHDLETRPSLPSDINLDLLPVGTEKRRTSTKMKTYPSRRSKSVDLPLPLEKEVKRKSSTVQVKTYAGRRLRSSSVDFSSDVKKDEVKTQRRTRTLSTSSSTMPTIGEDIEDEKSFMKTYSNQRRLTRRQAAALTAHASDVQNKSVIELSPEKTVIERKRSVEEPLENVSETSSLVSEGSATSTARQTRKRGRSASETSSTSSPRKVRAGSRDTSTLTKSKKKTPIDKLADNAGDSPGMRTRARTKSESSTASEDSEAGGAGSRKIVRAKSKLPKIAEENDNQPSTSPRK